MLHAPLLALLPLLAPPDPANDEVQHRIGGPEGVAWDARAVRHLFQRAGFGLPASEIPRHLARSPEEVVDALLRGPGPREPFFATPVGVHQYRDMASMDEEGRRRVRVQIRQDDRRQLRDYTHAWVSDMIDHVDPLRDRMTLFWHGFFTTSSRSLRRNYELVQQHQFVRQNAIESYADLLAHMVRDPALIYYLDNSSNRVGSPNENLARELMELFSLGEGNYSERDVQEVARALTGYTADREGAFRFDKKSHDSGVKEILGESGPFDGDDVVRILLRQEACARWVAGRIVEYLEGVAPSPERLDRYAGLLRSSGYLLAPMLRALLLDPDFYRDEVVGTRVMSPVDFAVGSARRLGIRIPPAFVVQGAASCGQTLFQPPNVKGWDEGLAWISTANLLQRGNLAGLMLGVTDFQSVLGGAGARPGAAGRQAGLDAMDAMDSMEMDAMDAMDSMEMDSMEAMEDAPRRPGAAGRAGAPVPAAPDGAERFANLRRTLGSLWEPRIHLCWRMQQADAQSDAEMVDALLASLLAIEPPPDVKPPLLRFLQSERERQGVKDGRFLKHPDACEAALRRLAHLILSLPEAQLS